MKIYTNGRYVRLRERFHNSAEIGAAINRGKTAVMERLKTGFTDREQFLILHYLGIEDTAENRKELFTP